MTARGGAPRLDRDDVERRLLAGEPVARIAAALGCTLAAVYYHERRLARVSYAPIAIPADTGYNGGVETNNGPGGAQTPQG